MKRPRAIFTENQKSVYLLLVNPANRKFPRTQSEVCTILGMSKTTCSSVVKRLLDLDIIRPHEHMKTNIYYYSGPTFLEIEKQIPHALLKESTRSEDNAQGVTDTPPSVPYRPLSRMHLSGGWIKFIVAEEGHLETISKGPSNNMCVLFGDVKPYKIRGSLNWQSTFSIDGQFFGIRYQRSRSNRFFYVEPEEKFIECAEAKDYADKVGPFLDRCRQLLAFLEKHGGWKFKHTETGDYLTEADIRDVGTPEFALDTFMSDLIKSRTGEFGVPGQSEAFTDKSVPGGEVEFTKADYVDAVHYLPHTHKTVSDLVAEFEEIKKQTLESLIYLHKMHHIEHQIIAGLGPASSAPDIPPLCDHEVMYQ